MRALQICSKPPLPAIDGGCLASYQLGKNLLKAGFELNVISLATEKHPYLPDEIDQQYSKDVHLDVLSVKTALNPLRLILNLFVNRSVQESRFYKRKFAEKLLNAIEQQDFDYIIFDGILSCFYYKDLRKKTKARLVYRSHNVESSLFEQRESNETNLLKKAYLSSQSARLKRFEIALWNSIDLILSISDKDVETMISEGANPGKIEVIPFSIEVGKEIPKPIKNSLFHLGAMDWKPNIDGIKWFVNRVWPTVHQSHSQIELHLGGKNIKGVKQDVSGDGIHIHDLVRDAESFSRSYDILIVPLHTGSGIRIKVLQAMARGNIVVSSKKGLEGIDVEHEKNVLIADNEEAFIQCLEKLFNDDLTKENLRMEAKKFIQKNYSPEILSEKLKTRILRQ